MNYLEKVAEFHKTFQHPIEEKPVIPTDRTDLRISLIQEELNELQVAITHNNLVEVADALCDLQYVLSGTILEFGLQDVFDKMFQNVHDSNMTKVCQDLGEVVTTIKDYEQKGIPVSFRHAGEGKFIVFRSSDNKVLKSSFYQKADIQQFL